MHKKWEEVEAATEIGIRSWKYKEDMQLQGVEPTDIYIHIYIYTHGNTRKTHGFRRDNPRR